MLTIIVLVSLLTCLPNQEVRYAQSDGQSVTQKADPVTPQCSQPTAERDALINEAEAGGYTVRRLMLLGNVYTGDEILHRSMLLREGDIFTRRKLVASLRSVSKLKTIYPVRLNDVALSLTGEPDKTVDLTICFKEKGH